MQPHHKQTNLEGYKPHLILPEWQRLFVLEQLPHNWIWTNNFWDRKQNSLCILLAKQIRKVCQLCLNSPPDLIWGSRAVASICTSILHAFVHPGRNPGGASSMYLTMKVTEEWADSMSQATERDWGSGGRPRGLYSTCIQRRQKFGSQLQWPGIAHWIELC